MNEDDLSRLKLVAMYTLRKAGIEATDAEVQAAIRRDSTFQVRQ